MYRSIFSLRLLFAVAVIGASVQSAQAKRTDTIFVDNDWKPCAYEQRMYYRILHKAKKRYVVHDYFLANQLQMSGSYKDKDLSVKDGLFTYYDSAGHITETGAYIDNKVNGLWQRNYPNSDRLEMKAWYTDNKREGVTEYYDSLTQKVVATGIFSDNEKSGAWVELYSNGIDTMAVEYYRNGKRNGHCTVYHRNHHVKEEGDYVANKREGEWQYYQENGALEDRIKYQNDSANGMTYSYDDNGKLRNYGLYKDNKLTGRWVVLYEGTTDTEMIKNYSEGLLHGYYCSMTRGSQIVFVEGNFYKGKKTGTWYEWWPNRYDTTEIREYLDSVESRRHVRQFDSVTHFLITEFYTANGLVEGKHASYYNDNRKQLESVCDYKAGKVDGTCTFYDETTGKVTYTQQYSECNEYGAQIQYYRYPDKIKSIETLIGEVFHGPVKYYRANGKLELEGQYNQNERTGIWKHYDERGKLEYTEDYNEGKHGEITRYQKGKPVR